MEVGECCRTGPGRSSDSGVLGSGTPSWVLGPHSDTLGTCKSGSWGAIVDEELALRGLGETPKQPSLVSVASVLGEGVWRSLGLLEMGLHQRECILHRAGRLSP